MLNFNLFSSIKNTESLIDEVALPIWWEQSEGSNANACFVTVSPGTSVHEVSLRICDKLGLPHEVDIQLSVLSTAMPGGSCGADAAAGARIVLDVSGEFTTALLASAKATDGLAIAIIQTKVDQEFMPKVEVGSIIYVLSNHHSDVVRECEVLDRKDDHVTVHYVGFDSMHDEWLSLTSDRIVNKRLSKASDQRRVSAVAAPVEANSASDDSSGSDDSFGSEIWDVHTEKSILLKGSGDRGLTAFEADEGTSSYMDCCSSARGHKLDPSMEEGSDDRVFKAGQELEDEEANCDMCLARKDKAREPIFSL